jgi:hypothetical protein
MSVAPDTGLAVGHGKGVDAGVNVGGMAVSVAEGSGVNVGGIGEDVVVGGIGESVSVGGIGVGGLGVEAGAHPLNKTISTKNTRNTDCIGFFMTLSPFDSVAHNAPNVKFQPPPALAGLAPIPRMNASKTRHANPSRNQSAGTSC